MTASQSEDLARAFTRDGAALVIQSLLNDAATKKTEAEDRAADVLRLLEEMAEHQVDAACCLMLSLWPVAGGLMMHDVCDRIGLWIGDNRTPAVIDYLKSASASEVDPDIKRYIEGFLHIENDAS